MYNPLFAHRALLLASLEVDDDTLTSPTPQNDAIPVSQLSVRSFRNQNINHSPLKGHSGTSSRFLTNPYAEISFEIALPYKKEGQTKLPWENLLIACGMENNTQNPDALALALIPSENKTQALSFRYYLDGQLYHIRNARGNAILILVPGQLPILRFVFIGQPAELLASTLPSSSFTLWENPIPVSPQNTTISLNSLSLSIQRLSLNLGNNLQMIHRTNVSASLIDRREPSGNITFDNLPINTFNPLDLIKREQSLPLSITHGDTSSLYWKISCSHIQLLEPSLQQDGNISGYSLPFAIHKQNQSDPDIEVFAS